MARSPAAVPRRLAEYAANDRPTRSTGAGDDDSRRAMTRRSASVYAGAAYSSVWRRCNTVGSSDSWSRELIDASDHTSPHGAGCSGIMAEPDDRPIERT